MATFLVIVERTELISFSVEAKNDDQARERYLMDGEEVSAKTVGIEIISVDEGDEE